MLWSVTEHGSLACHPILSCYFGSAARCKASCFPACLDWWMRQINLTSAVRAQLAHKFNVKSALEHCDAYLSKRAAEDFHFLRLGTVRLPCLSRHRDVPNAASVMPIILPGSMPQSTASFCSCCPVELAGMCRVQRSRITEASLPVSFCNLQCSMVQRCRPLPGACWTGLSWPTCITCRSSWRAASSSS